MPTMIRGGRATAATLAINADKRVVEMEGRILNYDPNAAPFVKLTSEASRMAVSNPEFKWLEDERTPTIDRVNNGGGYTAGDTSIVVDNGGYFRKNSILYIQRTGETMLVTAISTNTLTVTRSYGATAAAALLDNDQIQIIGGAAAEGAEAEDPITTKSVTKSNYCQIFRTPFKVTNTLQASELYGGNELSYQQKKAAIDHAIQQENAAWWGEKEENTGGNEPIRTTGGLDEVISTNDKDFAGVFSLEMLFDAAEDTFKNGSSRKRPLFAAYGVVSNISLEAGDKLRMLPSDETFGIDISQLLTPHGVLMVIPHKLFEGDEHIDRAYIVDMDHVGVRFLRGRDTKLKTNVQAPSADARMDEYLSEMGFKRGFEKSHCRIKNAA